ncbi:MAG: DUF3007 family protein [Cyanobacteria bacterium P01_H01_bin.130]
MRKGDALVIVLAIFLSGGAAYVVLQWFGLEAVDAGIWTQALLVVGLVGWLLSYVFRASTQNMTYHQQWKEYEDAVLAKRYEELSPEELAKLQAEVEADREAQQTQSSSQSQ